MEYQTKPSGGEKGRVGERERERGRESERLLPPKKSGRGHKVKLLGWTHSIQPVQSPPLWRNICIQRHSGGFPQCKRTENFTRISHGQKQPSNANWKVGFFSPPLFWTTMAQLHLWSESWRPLTQDNICWIGSNPQWKPPVNPSEEQQFQFMDLSLDCDASFLKNLATHQVGTGFCAFGLKWFNLSNMTFTLTRTNNYFFQSKLSNSDRNQLMGKR